MTMENRWILLLKYLLVLNGVYEIVFGVILVFLIETLLSLSDLLKNPINYFIFPQVAGLLAICFGILLCYSARDPETYMIIPLVSIFLRISLQLILIYNSTLYPFMAVAFLIFGMLDLVLAFLTFLLIKMAGLPIDHSEGNPSNDHQIP
ncbi:MAG: hypothetical protein ACFFFG_15785 [Candidatus Thorarchaeota archaeon]